MHARGFTKKRRGWKWKNRVYLDAVAGPLPCWAVGSQKYHSATGGFFHCRIGYPYSAGIVVGPSICSSDNKTIRQ